MRLIALVPQLAAEVLARRAAAEEPQPLPPLTSDVMGDPMAGL